MHTPKCKDFPAHTPVHSHTRGIASLHSPVCVLHSCTRKSVIKHMALCKDLDALSRVHAYTHMHAPHPFAHPRARRHECCSRIARSHVHATHAKLSPASTVHAATRNARSEVQHHLCTPLYAHIPALAAQGQNAAHVARPTRRLWLHVNFAVSKRGTPQQSTSQDGDPGFVWLIPITNETLAC